MRIPFCSSRYTSPASAGWIIFTPGLSIALVCLLITGCGGNSSSKTSKQSKTDAAAEEKSAKIDLLSSGVDIMDVRTLGMSTEPTQAISLFNSALGRSTDFKERKAATIKNAEAVWAQLLSESQQEKILDDLLTIHDSNHIWDASLSKQLSGVAVGDAEAELDRVVNVFEFIVRNLPLIARHPNDLPLTQHEIWTMGRATVKDRAWAFASILRQLGIDSVLLFPVNDNSQSDGFLTAVLLGDDVYLFDPRLGLAVPGPERGRPATLEEVMADSTLLSQLAVDDEHPHPLAGGALNQPQVKLVGNLSFWAPRMQELEVAFVGDRHVRLYDPLEDVEGRPGYVNRVAAVGGEHWNAQSLSQWDYPESQLSGREELSVSQADALRTLKDSWKASWQGTFDLPSQSDSFSASTRSQYAARTKQLVGEFADAKKRFVQIGTTNRQFERLQQGIAEPALFPQDSGQEKFNEDVNAEQQRDAQTVADYTYYLKLAPEGKKQVARELMELHRDNIRQHRIAARDADYWIGVCHFESGNIAASRQTFLRYLKNHPTGPWATGSRQFIAAGYAVEGDFKAAAEALAGTPESDPAYEGHQIQIRLWTKAESSK